MAGQALDPTVLRPRSIGEVFERAVSLCVRHFRTLALLALAPALLDTLLPIAFGSGGSTAAIQSRDLRFTVVMPLILLVLGALPIAAIVAAAASLSRGNDIDVGAAYRIGLHKWSTFVLIELLSFGIVLVPYGLDMGAAVGLSLVGLAPLGAVMVLLCGVSLLAAIPGLPLLLVVSQYAYFASAVEGASAWQAFRSGLRRASAPGGRLQSFLGGLAFVAFLAVTAFVSAGGRVLGGGLAGGGSIAATLIEVLLVCATGMFSAAFFAVLYYDVRFREERLDAPVAAESVRA